MAMVGVDCGSLQVDSQPKSSGLVLHRRLLGAVLRSSNEPGELSQWICHDDSTININMHYYYYYYCYYFNFIILVKWLCVSMCVRIWIEAPMYMYRYSSCWKLCSVGMGCFWGAERKFWQRAGVVSTQVSH